MDQGTFEMAATALAAEAGDRRGFEIGWDHARHGLVPPPVLLDGTAVGQGWHAARAVFGRRQHAASRTTRQHRLWLALRSQAWREDIAFDAQLTPTELARIEVVHCPVTRRALLGSACGAPASADTAVVARLDRDAGYAPGRIALLGAQAAEALGSDDARGALRRAARCDAGIEPLPAALDSGAMWRLAVLQSFAAPLPFGEAVRIPLRMLPPPRVHPRSAVQRLQRQLTLMFATPGWSQRLRAFAESLRAFDPSDALRHDFNLFVSAFAARAPRTQARDACDARIHPVETRRALEDAWACPRVARRWQQFALAAGEAAVERLLARFETR